MLFVLCGCGSGGNRIEESRPAKAASWRRYARFRISEFKDEIRRCYVLNVENCKPVCEWSTHNIHSHIAYLHKSSAPCCFVCSSIKMYIYAVYSKCEKIANASWWYFFFFRIYLCYVIILYAVCVVHLVHCSPYVTNIIHMCAKPWRCADPTILDRLLGALIILWVCIRKWLLWRMRFSCFFNAEFCAIDFGFVIVDCQFLLHDERWSTVRRCSMAFNMHGTVQWRSVQNRGNILQHQWRAMSM